MAPGIPDPTQPFAPVAGGAPLEPAIGFVDIALFFFLVALTFATLIAAAAYAAERRADTTWGGRR